MALMPKEWILAHRCTDLSAKFGKSLIGKAISESVSLENRLSSMKLRFENGYGIETDLRTDQNSNGLDIIISHDPPKHGDKLPSLRDIFELYNSTGCGAALALNIKDAGLQSRLRPILDEYAISNYFTFDGANPDVLSDSLAGITAFGRESEIEPFNDRHTIHPLANYSTISGVWMDNFMPAPWIDEDTIQRHFERGKDVAIVSPELHPWARGDHGETMKSHWLRYRTSLRNLRDRFPDRRMMLCTKFAALAEDYFNSGG